MAQWLGQFSGLTHLTKVQDAECLLAHAVATLRTTDPEPARAKKGKAVDRLAGQLLKARLKWLKAQLSEKTEGQSERTLAQRAVEIEILRRREANIRMGGLAAILIEFAGQNVRKLDLHSTESLESPSKRPKDRPGLLQADPRWQAITESSDHSLNKQRARRDRG